MAEAMPENVSQLSKLIPVPTTDLTCQTLIQMSDVSKYGFLRKMPSSWSGRIFDTVLNRKWSCKFIVLRAGCVYIYGNETAVRYERANSLFGFQEVQECENTAFKAVKWVFQVVDALRDHDRDRSFFFSANSEDHMKEWMESFKDEIIKGNIMIFNPNTQPAAKPNLKHPVSELQSGSRTMPKLTEEVRNRMRESMIVATNVNICHDSGGSSDESYTEIDDEEIEKVKKKKVPTATLR